MEVPNYHWYFIVTGGEAILQKWKVNFKIKDNKSKLLSASQSTMKLLNKFKLLDYSASMDFFFSTFIAKSLFFMPNKIEHKFKTDDETTKSTPKMLETLIYFSFIHVSRFISVVVGLSRAYVVFFFTSHHLSQDEEENAMCFMLAGACLHWVCKWEMKMRKKIILITWN